VREGKGEEEKRASAQVQTDSSYIGVWFCVFVSLKRERSSGCARSGIRCKGLLAYHPWKFVSLCVMREEHRHVRLFLEIPGIAYVGRAGL